MASIVGNPTGSVGEGRASARPLGEPAKTPAERYARQTGGTLGPSRFAGRGQRENYATRGGVRQEAMAKASRAGHRGRVPQQVRENIKGEKAFGPGVQNFRNPNESYIGRGGP